MMIFKKFLKVLFLSCLFFAASGVMAASVSAAPRLFFDPSAINSTLNSEFTVTIKIDVENSSAFGADAILNYPSADLTLKSVTNGGFFTDFSQAPGTGQVEIHGYFSAANQTKSGSGVFATAIFVPNKNSGTGVMNFTCTGSGNDTQIISGVGTNILACSSLNQLTVNYAGESGSQSSTTTAEPNSCGGTCGSHYNCKAGLFCSQGFCRNPECPSETTCGCQATPSPKSTSKAIARKANPTPEVVTLAAFTPIPTPKPESPLEPLAAPESQVQERKVNLKPVGVVAAVLLIVAASMYLISKRGSKPPKTIQPPTGGPTIPPPPPSNTF